MSIIQTKMVRKNTRCLSNIYIHLRTNIMNSRNWALNYTDHIGFSPNIRLEQNKKYVCSLAHQIKNYEFSQEKQQKTLICCVCP